MDDGASFLLRIAFCILAVLRTTSAPYFVAVFFFRSAVALDDEHQNNQVVTFVNELPDTSIDLYWENHENGDRKFEGSIRPKGGFLRVESFVGHGKITIIRT
jgi:hypothetical protein